MLRSLLTSLFFAPLQVALGLSRTHQDTDPSAVSEYYVPSFATLTFFMMEWFVNLIGFDGDEDVSTRESVFAALDALQHAMIVRSDYYRVPLDAPGFTFDSVDPYDYGVGRHTKDLQIHEVTSSGRLAHRFGTALPRYEPDLGPAGYRFPVCPPEHRLIRTRPNTPADTLVGE